MAAMGGGSAGLPYGLQAMLKEGHQHISGTDEAVLRSIEACLGLAGITRTSFGPTGAPPPPPPPPPPPRPAALLFAARLPPRPRELSGISSAPAALAPRGPGGPGPPVPTPPRVRLQCRGAEPPPPP